MCDIKVEIKYCLDRFNSIAVKELKLTFLSLRLLIKSLCTRNIHPRSIMAACRIKLSKTNVGNGRTKAT